MTFNACEARKTPELGRRQSNTRGLARCSRGSKPWASKTGYDDPLECGFRWITLVPSRRSHEGTRSSTPVVATVSPNCYRYKRYSDSNARVARGLTEIWRGGQQISRPSGHSQGAST